MNRGVSIIQLSYSEVSWVQFELEVSTLQWTCFTLFYKDLGLHKKAI